LQDNARFGHHFEEPHTKVIQVPNPAHGAPIAIFI
jgi:hypothetical protein